MFNVNVCCPHFFFSADIRHWRALQSQFRNFKCDDNYVSLTAFLPPKQPVVTARHKLHMNASPLLHNTQTCEFWLTAEPGTPSRTWPLTCFPCHGLEPHDEPQQCPREAHLDGEQLLSLSPPGFAPPSVQHHSSSDGRLRHPFNHHAGHGAPLSGRAFRRNPRVVVQRYEELKRAEEEEAAERRAVCVCVCALNLLDESRYDLLVDGFVKSARVGEKNKFIRCKISK